MILKDKYRFYFWHNFCSIFMKGYFSKYYLPTSKKGSLLMKFYFKLLTLGTIFLTPLYMFACSGSSGSGSSSSTSALTTIDTLPKATNPVTDSSSSSLSKGLMKAATTGMPMGTTDSADFDTSSSIAACEMFNQTNNAIGSAAFADMVLCFIQQAAGDLTSVYDGNPHVFDIASAVSDDMCGEDCGLPDKIKFSVTRGSDGTITDFTMVACTSGEQTDYLSQTISGDSLTIVEKFVSDMDSGQTDVSATLNSDGQFEGTKAITQQFSFSGGDSTGWGIIHFNQGSDSATMDGIMNFSYSWEGTTWANTAQVVGSMELLDGNAADADPYDIGLLALGDGAVNGAYSWSNGSSSNAETFLEGWNGDTREVDSTAAAAYLSDVSSETLPTATEPSIAFEGDEADACSGTSEGTVTMTNSFFTACSAYNLDHGWLDCWNTINPNQANGD